MTTLIVGCGYLGRRVGALLSRRGERVWGTVRFQQSAERVADGGIEPVIADVLDPTSLERLPEAERLVYCVGFDRKSGASMRSVYVDGLRAVLSRVAPRAERLVYASSTGVYGQDDGGWIDEDSPTEPRSESGRVCLEGEDVVREREGGRAVVLRFAGLYGPGRIVRREAIAQGEPITGDPERFLNLIHIDDAAHAVVVALDHPEPGPLYVTADDRPVRRSEYYGLVASLLGAPEPRFLPASAGTGASRDEANKRAKNARIKAELSLDLTFPDIRSGVPDALGRADEPPMA